MKTLIAIILASVTYSLALGQSQITAVHHQGQISYYRDFAQAFSAAAEGDTLYLPGGDIVQNLVITNTVHLIGTGYRVDSSAATGATRILGPVTLQNDADSSSFQGIWFMDGVTTSSAVEGCLFARCAISGGLTLSGSSAKNVFRETFFAGGANLGNAHSTRFYNCVLPSVTDIGRGTLFDHCVVGGGLSGEYFTATSCIISAYVSSSSTNVIRQCVTNANFNNIFVSTSSTVSIYNDYHLATGGTNPAVGTGAQGTDCGIYDGPYPLRDDRHPSTPRFRYQRISPYTDAAGNLQVEVEVIAPNQ